MNDETAKEIKSLHKSGLSVYKISQKLSIHPYHIGKTLFPKDIPKIYNKDCKIKSKKQIFLEWIEKHYLKSDCEIHTSKRNIPRLRVLCNQCIIWGSND